MVLFEARVAKVGGNRLGIYLPLDACKLLDVRHGDTLAFRDPSKPRDLVVSMRCDISRAVRPRPLLELLGSVEDIAQRCAGAFYLALGVSPLTPEEERWDTLMDNVGDAWIDVQKTLEALGCPWSYFHEECCPYSEDACANCERDYVNEYANGNCTFDCRFNADGQGIVEGIVIEDSTAGDHIVMCCKNPLRNPEPEGPLMCDGEGCGFFDLDHEELRSPFWKRFDALIASQLGEDWRDRLGCGSL